MPVLHHWVGDTLETGISSNAGIAENIVLTALVKTVVPSSIFIPVLIVLRTYRLRVSGCVIASC